MDDVLDLRTQLIYASLADHELVRQLEEARAAAVQRTGAAGESAAVSPRPQRALGTRPWAATNAAHETTDDLLNADVTTSGAEAYVVDIREPDSRGASPDVTAPTLQTIAVGQRSSEWSTDDSSYYLG